MTRRSLEATIEEALFYQDATSDSGYSDDDDGDNKDKKEKKAILATAHRVLQDRICMLTDLLRDVKFHFQSVKMGEIK
jgi:hypothetical protein